MFYPNMLLKVVSIIMIVFAVFSAISLVGSVMVFMSASEAITPGFADSGLGSSIVSASMWMGALGVLSYLVPGILGLIGRGYKVCVAIGIINFFMVLISLFTKFGFPAILGITLMAVYLAGLYQSEAQY